MKHSQDRTSKQITDIEAANSELAQLRQRVAELEALEIKHKRAEEALAHERNLLRTLIDNLPDYIYFKDINSQFVIGNAALAQLMGANTPDELVGKSDFDFYPETLAQQYYADEQAIIASGQPLIKREEPVIDQISAEKRWLSTTKIPLRDGQGKIIGLVGMGRDITERKQTDAALRQSKQQAMNVLEHLEELVDERTAALKVINQQLQEEIVEREWAEQALRESESKYRVLMEQASDGILIADGQGNLLEVNPRGCAMLGYSQQELLQRNIFRDFIPAEDLAIKPLHLNELLAGQAVLVERRLRCKDGALLPVEISAKILADGRLQAIVRDITERQKAQESLQRYAERLKTLQELDRAILSAQSPEAVAQAALHHIQQLVPCQQAAVVGFDFDTYGAVMLAAYVNGEARVMVGAHPPLDMFGIAEELRQSRVKAPENILTLAQPPIALQALSAEGVRSFINVPLVARGKLIGSLNLGADTLDALTPEHVDIAREVADPLALAIQQVRLHEQVQHYAAELEQRVAERTAELEEINDELKSFSFSVSHDLRAPLRAVQGFAAALLEDHADALEPQGQDYAERIVAAAQRMDTLIQDLLIYSRLSRTDLRLQPVDLAAVVTDALSQLEVTLQERQAQIIVEAPLAQVVGHYATLVQIVANLLTNGVKFVPPGVQPQVRIWADAATESGVRLWVEDNGIGIEPKHQERIFHIFERLHGIEAYPGTGIGLAVVRKGVARMGGRAGVESAPGRGSKFWIELPQAVG